MQCECSPIPLAAMMHPQASPAKPLPRAGGLPLGFKALPELPKTNVEVEAKISAGQGDGEMGTYVGWQTWMGPSVAASEVLGLNALNAAPCNMNLKMSAWFSEVTAALSILGLDITGTNLPIKKKASFEALAVCVSRSCGTDLGSQKHLCPWHCPGAGFGARCWILRL